MQKLLALTIEALLLGFTAVLTLANPVVIGVEYGLKRGWFKSRRGGP